MLRNSKSRERERERMAPCCLLTNDKPVTQQILEHEPSVNCFHIKMSLDVPKQQKSH